MKLLKTDINGGFPLVLDDIRFGVGGITEAIALLTAGIAENFIVSGLAVTITPGTPNTLTHTAGVVCFGGEICNVDALVSPLNVDAFVYFTKVTTYDPAGNKVFENAVSNDTYQINKVVIGSGASVPVGSVDITSVFYLNKAVANLAFSRPANAEIVSEMISDVDAAAFTCEYVSGDTLKYLDSSLQLAVITFKTTDATPSFVLVPDAGSTPAGTRDITTPDGEQYTVKDGETIIFVNDGTVFRMLSGGLNSTDTEIWHEVDDVGEPPFLNNWTSPGLVQFIRTAAKTVTIAGAISATVAVTPGTTCFTLPAGYRPSTTLQFFYTDMVDRYVITIDTSGNLSIDSPTSPPANFTVPFTISFPAA